MTLNFPKQSYCGRLFALIPDDSFVTSRDLARKTKLPIKQVAHFLSSLVNEYVERRKTVIFIRSGRDRRMRPFTVWEYRRITSLAVNYSRRT